MRAIIVTAVVGLSIASGAAAAGHRPVATTHCTYENGASVGRLSFATEDPTGLTADGAINNDSCIFEFPDSDPGRDTTGDINEAFGFATSGALVVEGQYGSAQAAIVDDVFGTNVGGTVAADLDHDTGFGGEGEPSVEFCGTSPVLTSDADVNGDGHADFGWAVAVFTHGPVGQAMFCDPVAGPTGTSGGILNPAGGIYLTVGG